MRKAKRFTPALIRRYIDEGRGQGVHQNFTAFHQVGRADPPSRGTSSIIPARGQLSTGHLLSVEEATVHEFTTMVPGVDDRRHQVRLSLDCHTNCLTEYSMWDDERIHPGTLDICRALHIKHPVLRRDGDLQDWIFTSDIVLTLLPRRQRRHMLAIAVKDVSFSQLKKRARNLLKIEREFWLVQGHRWILVTPECFSPEVAEAVMRYAGFAHRAEPIDGGLLDLGATAVKRHGPQNLTVHLYGLMDEFRCDMERAQDLFWQGVWTRRLPIDWTSALWASDTIRFVSLAEFDTFNPVVSGRSAWPT